MSIRLSVCLSVRVFTFEVPFKCLFAPTSRIRRLYNKDQEVISRIFLISVLLSALVFCLPYAGLFLVVKKNWRAGQQNKFFVGVVNFLLLLFSRSKGFNKQKIGGQDTNTNKKNRGGGAFFL